METKTPTGKFHALPATAGPSLHSYRHTAGPLSQQGAVGLSLNVWKNRTQHWPTFLCVAANYSFTRFCYGLKRFT